MKVYLSEIVEVPPCLYILGEISTKLMRTATSIKKNWFTIKIPPSQLKFFQII